MSCDSRQGGEENSVPQIEVTVEMIQAGVAVLSELDLEWETSEVIARIVYEAMAMAAPCVDRPSGEHR